MFVSGIAMTEEGEEAFNKLIEFTTIFLRIILSMSLIYASEVDKYPRENKRFLHAALWSV